VVTHDDVSSPLRDLQRDLADPLIALNAHLWFRPIDELANRASTIRDLVYSWNPISHWRGNPQREFTAALFSVRRV